MSKWLSIFHSINNIPPSNTSNNNNLNQDSNFGEQSKNINNQTNNLLSFAKNAKIVKNSPNNLNNHSFGNFDNFGKRNENLKSVYDENELDKVEIFEERAAIIEYDANIPNVWAEAIAKVQLRSNPKTITQEKWSKIKIALKILSSHLQDIIDHEWRIGDVFGCHVIVPEVRCDVMGLLMLLNEGDAIIEITKNVIRIENKRGKILSYCRPFYHLQIEQSYLYEIQ